MFSMSSLCTPLLLIAKLRSRNKEAQSLEANGFPALAAYSSIYRHTCVAVPLRDMRYFSFISAALVSVSDFVE